MLWLDIDLLLIHKTNLNLYFIMYMAFPVIRSNAYDVNKKNMCQVILKKP